FPDVTFDDLTADLAAGAFDAMVFPDATFDDLTADLAAGAASGAAYTLVHEVMKRAIRNIKIIFRN
ncbi:MAG: hypothetical protein ACRDBM_12870, partial [Sporomusa sp.]